MTIYISLVDLNTTNSDWCCVKNVKHIHCTYMSKYNARIQIFDIIKFCCCL